MVRTLDDVLVLDQAHQLVVNVVLGRRVGRDEILQLLVHVHGVRDMDRSGNAIKLPLEIKKRILFVVSGTRSDGLCALALAALAGS